MGIAFNKETREIKNGVNTSDYQDAKGNDLAPWITNPTKSEIDDYKLSLSISINYMIILLTHYIHHTLQFFLKLKPTIYL